MTYEENLERYKMHLENARNTLENEYQLALNKGDEKSAGLFLNSIETTDYQLENLEASYTMEAMHWISSVTYSDNYNAPDKVISSVLGFDVNSKGIYSSSYGNHNREDYRQKLIEAAELKVEVPTLAETKKIFENIQNSDLSPQEKQASLIKYECLSGLSLEGSTANRYGLAPSNLSSNISRIKEEQLLDVFYENGLKKHTL